MGESSCCSQLHRPGCSERHLTPNLKALSSLLDTTGGEIKGQGGWLAHTPKSSPCERDFPVRAAGFPRSSSPCAVQAAPPRPGRPPHPHPTTTALPSQLRLHLEEIAQSIPVGTFDPVIRDEAPGPWSHTGSDRRAGRGRARGHRDFEHLRGGTPEAATAVAVAAGARSPAACCRLQTQEREVASFTHAHTHRRRRCFPPSTPRASPGALSCAQAAAPFQHSQKGGREGGWVEKGARYWERVWRENPVAASRRGEAEAQQRREIPSPFALSLPTSPSPSPPLLLPPRNLSSPLPFFLSHPQAVAAAERVWAAPDAGAWGKHEDQSIIPRALPREPGAWKAPRAVGRSLQEWRAPSALWEHMGLDHQAEGEKGTWLLLALLILPRSASRWRVPPTYHQLISHSLFIPLSKLILAAGEGALWSSISQSSCARPQLIAAGEGSTGSSLT